MLGERVRNLNRDGDPVPYGQWVTFGTDLQTVSEYEPPDESWMDKWTWVSRDSKTTTDMVTPNWNKLRNSGAIVNNPFHSVHVKSRVSSPSTYTHIYKSGPYYYKRGGKWRFSVPGFLTLDENEIAAKRASCINLATTQAFAQINSEELLAYATLAESRKTVDSVVSMTRRAYSILRAAKRFNLSALKKELSPREVANRYMEARYAIRPLIYDVAGVISAFETERKTIRETYRGYCEDEVRTTDTAENFSDGETYSVSDFARETKWKCTVRSGVLCDADVTTASILGAPKVFEAAWELVPFSFIADWFANTGDWIAAHTPDVGVRQRASWASVYEEYTKSVAVKESRCTAAQFGGTSVSYSPPPMSYITTTATRERIVDPRMDMFPAMKMKLDMFKLTDLGIILRRL